MTARDMFWSGPSIVDLGAYCFPNLRNLEFPRSSSMHTFAGVGSQQLTPERLENPPARRRHALLAIVYSTTGVECTEIFWQCTYKGVMRHALLGNVSTG